MECPANHYHRGRSRPGGPGSEREREQLRLVASWGLWPLDEHVKRHGGGTGIASLVVRTCEGDEEAWQTLWRWLDPRLSARW